MSVPATDAALHKGASGHCYSTNNALKWQALANWMWDFREVWDSIIKHYAGWNPQSEQQRLWATRIIQDMETASLLQKYVWPTKEPQTYRQL